MTGAKWARVWLMTVLAVASVLAMTGCDWANVGGPW